METITFTVANDAIAKKVIKKLLKMDIDVTFMQTTTGEDEKQEEDYHKEAKDVAVKLLKKMFDKATTS